jgi:hypothetical protein
MWYVVILMCAVKKWSVEMVIGLVPTGSPGSPTGRRDLLSQWSLRVGVAETDAVWGGG